MRIKRTMSALEMISAVSGGVPGTLAVIAGITAEYRKVDPDNTMGIFGYLLTMDAFQVYDGDLWNIHSRLCEMQIVKTIAILRALQLGILTTKEINIYLKGGIVSLDFYSLILDIRSKVKNFAKDYKM
jgi:hypothetical protein